MNLPDLKQLNKIIALCRKKGVKSIKIDNVELTLGDEPHKELTRKSNMSDTAPEFESDTLTDEQLLYFSVTDAEGIQEAS